MEQVGQYQLTENDRMGVAPRVAGYRQKVMEVRRQLAALPSPDDNIVLFDRFRSEVRSFPETVDAASDEKRRELVSLLVERVETDDRHVAGWSGRLRRGPSSRRQQPKPKTGRCGVKRPRTDSNRRRAP